MSYEPTNWKTGDVVTSAKLNKLENGVANSGAGFLKVTTSYDEQTDANVMDKTWQEIYDALANGEYVSLSTPFVGAIIQSRIAKADPSGGLFKVLVKYINPDNTEEDLDFTCPTANDYPSHELS